ncbi:MAG: hypothetical protein GY929_05140 [Actinomycetia bacterium]|nr:hypothetical protein [Actinomycetes bacterium]
MGSGTTIDRPTGFIEGPSAWYGRDVRNDTDWLIELSDADVDEVHAGVHQVDEQGLAMLDMTSTDFPLPTLAPRMTELAATLDRGRGFWLMRACPSTT